MAPAGFAVTVSPATLAVPATASARFTVRFTRTTAVYDKWSFGSLTWKDKSGHAVRSPLAVRPSALAAPPTLSAPGTIQVVTGFSDEVQHALADLPEEFRVAVVLSDVADLSYEDIAAALGVPIGTVRSRLHRGRRMLRKTLTAGAAG